MTDPLGLISRAGGTPPIMPRQPGAGAQGGADFKQQLLEQIQQVNDAQKDATSATNDLLTGKRDDLEGVMLATQEADSAFRALLAVRNKVVAAYDEIRQIRV
ncbi:MAG: flagellar hook-basal body complex protein FliE [Phycisphaerales bacterium]|nr:flagellar hook-basal body complex protein FliE [Phycisphaerales bacterium]